MRESLLMMLLAEAARGTGLGVAVVLAVAAWAKARDRGSTRTTVLALFPVLRRRRSAHVEVIVVSVVVAELLLAITLVVDTHRMFTAVMYATAATAFLGVNVLAWRQRVSCGCFGGRTRHQTARATLVRGALMAAAAPVVTAGAWNPPASPTPSLTWSIAAGFCAVVLVNEWSARVPSASTLDVVRTRVSRRVHRDVVKRLRRDLRHAVDFETIRHGDLAWWAADVSRVSQRGGPPRAFLATVPGRHGHLNAVLHEHGSTHLALLTPGGPVSAVTARLDVRNRPPATWSTR